MKIEHLLPEADMIIHAGDSTGRGTTEEIRDFCEWYGGLDYKYKILIPGNHDWGFEKDYKKHKKICEDNGIILLHDDGITIEGIKIHGSGNTPEYCNWAFNCWRTHSDYALDRQQGEFQKGYDFIGKYWDMIPNDTDILITHGPPKYILDLCRDGNVGCDLLRQKIEQIKPQYHIFGHIHETAGECISAIGTSYINAAVLDGRYAPNKREIKVYNIESSNRIWTKEDVEENEKRAKELKDYFGGE